MADYEEFDPDVDDLEEYDDYEREAPEVYRRRRIAAIIIALLVIIGLVWAIVFAFGRISAGLHKDDGQPAATSGAGNNFESFTARPTDSASASASASASGDPRESASPDASASASVSDKPKPTPSDTEKPEPQPTTTQPVQACSDSLTVTTTVDRQSYGQGQNPVITAHAKNSSSNPCTVDIGAGKVTFQITSGPAHVYDSVKCLGAPVSKEATVQPGAEQVATTTWDRGINAYGCGAAATPAQTGYYWVTATVNGVSSQPSLIIIK